MKNILACIALGLILTACALAEQQRAKEAAAEGATFMKECRAKRDDGEFKGRVAEVNCYKSDYREAYAKRNYGYMDLIDLMLAKRLEIAEKIDKHKISPSQGDLEFAKFRTQLVQLEESRIAQANQQRMVRSQLSLEMMKAGAAMAAPPPSTQIICNSSTMGSGAMTTTVCH